MLTANSCACVLLLRYNKASHKSQGVVELALGSTTIKKGRGKAVSSAGGDDGGLPPASDAESEPDEEADVDVSKFQKKPRAAAKPKAAATGAAKGKRKAPAAAKSAPKKRRT